MDDASLSRYADALVRDAVRTRSGDLLAVHGEPAHRDLIVAIAAAGYRAGARYVDTIMTDPRIKRVRALYAAEDTLAELPRWHHERMVDVLEANGAVITLAGVQEPGLLGDVPPERAAKERSRTLPGYLTYMEALGKGEARFLVAGYPTEAWALEVYPEHTPADAVEALWQDLLYFARIGPDDPADGWARHVVRLGEVADRLSERGLTRLRLRAPGTDLEIGIPEGTRWIGGTLTSHGLRFSPNVPTEEVFTSPHPPDTSGTFRCSKPLDLEGRTIDGIEGEFKDGKLARIEAAREADRDYLAAYFSRDEGAGRLGEIALVDGQSRVGSRGRTYANTLLDENAASHMAFGRGFGFCRAEGAPAPNLSSIHIDVMIGTPDMVVTGTDARGDEVDVLVDGAFA